MFVTTTIVNVRSAPGLAAPKVGELAKGQEIQVSGMTAVRDEYIWHRIAGEDELWVAEGKTDGSLVLLKWTGAAPKPTPTRSTGTFSAVGPKPNNTASGLPPAGAAIDPLDYERTKLASFAITRSFEGGGFDSYNNYDAGIVSYGIFQFTLAAGSLGRVLQRYLDTGDESPTAQALRSEYLKRVQERDAALRNDTRFRDLLKAAAQEKPMQEAQIAVATTSYWDVVIQNYIVRRGTLRLPLTYALFFDMGINFGVNHGFVRLAEQQLGVTPNSRTGENGITEEQLTTRVAELRRESHYRQAERDNLPGLKVRGDFWYNICRQGDWFLEGDANGFVQTKPGVRVQVRNPV